MRIKVDEDLPPRVVEALQDAGHEAIGVVDQGMGGWKDAPLWAAVQAEQRFFVTADKGFADIRFYTPGTHFGVLLLRPDQDGIRPLVVLLEHVLANYDLEGLVGAIVVSTPRGTRIRRSRV
jgi:predicted nuclease of predicted toxin-antitoxin system